MSEGCKLIVLCGPTASGKTGLAIRIAQELGGEIVSADSMQVYRGMDIGTAKPTVAERGGIAHHMLDVVEPGEPYNAALYQRGARACIADIAARGKLPILCGGTGLYINAVLYPLDFAEKTTVFNRESLYQAAWLGLTMARERLYRRIDRRVDDMIAAGLMGEVRGLLERTSLSRTASQAIGYKEIIAHLQGQCTLEGAIAQIKQGSRRYAKRQMTWFRREGAIHWLDVDELADGEVLLQAALGDIRGTLNI